MIVKMNDFCMSTISETQAEWRNYLEDASLSNDPCLDQLRKQQISGD